jgi:hypothetical protein
MRSKYCTVSTTQCCWCRDVLPSCRQLLLQCQPPTTGTPVSNPARPAGSSSTTVNSPLSTPSHPDSPDTPTPGFSYTTVNAQQPLNPAAAAQGQHGGCSGSTQGSGTVGSDGFQVWRPCIRFLGSPSCSIAQHTAAAAATAAAGSDSASASGSGQAGTAGVSSSEVTTPAQNAASRDTGGSIGSNNSTQPQCSSSIGCVGAQHAERRLLSSSWSIRKKNLAPASYRAAQQAECAAAQHAQQAQHTASATQAATTAGHTHSNTTMTVEQRPAAEAASGGQPTDRDLEGSAAEQASSSSSGSGWQVQCRGQLSVNTGAYDDQGGGDKGAAEPMNGTSMATQGERLPIGCIVLAVLSLACNCAAANGCIAAAAANSL